MLPAVRRTIERQAELVRSHRLLPLDRYSHIIVSYSGGKDSLALAILASEIMPAGKVELWHQLVDGQDEGFMDWPCTAGYCRATAKALGLPLYFQWRDGGFRAELLRENSRTKGVFYQDQHGATVYKPPSERGKLGTRRQFPQLSSDLSVRWCSAYLKIDVARRVLSNDPRFVWSRVLFLTGERRQESAARSMLPEVEVHPCTTRKRHVDSWRAILDWTEEDVWAIIRSRRIVPHPAYRLGWGRVSCMTCIFGDHDQWASVRSLVPERFQRIAAYEGEFGKTIRRGLTVVQQADRGRSFLDPAKGELARLALGTDYPDNQVILPDDQEWELPAGAFKRCGGPT